MKRGQERQSRRPLKAVRSIVGTKPPSSVALLFLGVLLLAFNVHVGQAQQPAGDSSRFRVERTSVQGGGELLTIWGRVAGESGTIGLPAGSATLPRNQSGEIPLLTVLRDTLGDANRENDVLREVWVHTYAPPKLVQQAAALVPFLYKGIQVKPQVSLRSRPPAITNLSDPGQPVWRRLFLSSVTKLAIDQPLLRTSVHNYQRNVADYRKSNLARALTILSLYENEAEATSEFSEAELIQMQAQFALTDKTFGGLVDSIHFPKFHEKDAIALRDTRGHNWELLRQQAEAAGLYFEPLRLDEKTVTHALLWFPVESLTSNDSETAQQFQGRFLNIKNPWRDKRLRQWKGYSETKFFNAENQPVLPDSSYTRSVHMIPLALYGLDFQKIPALLIDFRDSANPRRRELSGRLINDITRDVLSISKFGNIYYFAARSTFDFVTGKRGIDVNQPSRLRSAAELRLLLSFNANLKEGLRDELHKGLKSLSVNPLEIGSTAEREVAFAQYQALQHYAALPTGLPSRLQRERESEAAKFTHQGLDGKLMRIANVVSLGRYSHREKLTPELSQQLDKRRQLAYHTRFLRQLARSTPSVEVTSNMEEVLASLRYISEHGSEKDNEAAKVVGSIFSRTADDQAKDLCLSALQRIGNKEAMKEMSRIYHDVNVADQWRAACAEYLGIEQPQRSKTVSISDGSHSDTVERP